MGSSGINAGTWAARDREVVLQNWSLRGESLEVSAVAYEAETERSDGVVGFSSGRYDRTDQPPLPEREGRFKDKKVAKLTKIRSPKTNRNVLGQASRKIIYER